MNTLGIVIVAVVVVVLVAAAVLIMRRRAQNADVLPPPELSEPVDYTSLPVDEPMTFGDRVRATPLPLKILAGLLLVFALAMIGVVYFAFIGSGTADTPPVGPPPEITNVTATVADEQGSIVVRADTNLPDGTTVDIALQEDGQPFDWASAETATAPVENGRISATVERRGDAPVPDAERAYTVVLSATGPNDQTVTSEAAEVRVPSLYQSAFYSGGVASAPTDAAPTPTRIPATVAPTTPAPTETPAPEATAVPTYTATVFNGGRIRSAPTTLEDNQVGTINANETVQVLEKNDSGTWYRITDQRGTTGWVSASLLRIDASVAEQVPVAGQGEPTGTATAANLTATVFNGGRIRSAPDLNANNQVGTINAGETVQLLGKSADGLWYRITDQRGTTGWVYFNLLTVPADVAEQVPVAP